MLGILETEEVFSQEEFIVKLKELGISATQATLSRDLKALGIVKMPGVGYKLQMKNVKSTPETLSSGIQSLEFSGNLAVIKTIAGLAPALAVFIDHTPPPPIMGTIAGDDTVLLIMRNGFIKEDVIVSLSEIFPNIPKLAVYK